MKLLAFLLPALAFAAAPPGPESVYNDAGYITTGEKNLFYWMFESRNDPATDPVMLWMSGGPGCSSQLALFGENGPYIVEDDLSLTLNEFSWNNNATVIWIDQPVGTGFSYGGVPVHNEDGVAPDVFDFLQGFFDKYETKNYRDLPFHVFGESYAGHYVPAVTREIVRRNAAGADKPINLKGFAIGNGLTDPEVQYKSYVPYTEEHGLVEESALTFMKVTLKMCEPLIATCNSEQISRAGSYAACLGAYMFCNLGQTTPVTSTGVNPYDVRVPCGRNKLCYDFSNIDAYLALDEVREAFGVPDHKKWQECSTLVNLAMSYGVDWMHEFKSAVSEVLGAGVKGMLYAGEYDFICNWMGNHAWSLTMEWAGQDELNAAKNTSWVSTDGETSGSYITAKDGQFTFLKFLNGGHMVPRDQPAKALDMVNKHLFEKWE